MKKVLLIVVVAYLMSIFYSCGNSFNNDKAIKAIKKDIFSGDSVKYDFSNGIRDVGKYKVAKINSINIYSYKKITELDDSTNIMNICNTDIKQVDNTLKLINERLEYSSPFYEKSHIDTLKKNKAILEDFRNELSKRASNISNLIFNKKIGNNTIAYSVKYRLSITTDEGQQKVFDTTYSNISTEYVPYNSSISVPNIPEYGVPNIDF